MPRDEGSFCGASLQEIVTKHCLQVPQRLSGLVFSLRLKTADAFEAFDMVVPLQELHYCSPLKPFVTL